MKIRTDLKAIKRYYIEAAKDLCYGREVIERIETASSENEICGIMSRANTSQNYPLL